MSLSTLSPLLHRPTTALPTAIADYDPATSILLASADYTVLAQGPHTQITGRLLPSPAPGSPPDPAPEARSGSAPVSLAEQVAHALAASDHRFEAIAAGAIGFDGSAQLSVPTDVQWSAPLPPAPRTNAPPRAWRIEQTPPPALYLAAVRTALKRIEQGSLDKVVLARQLELTLQDGRPIDVRQLLSRLVGHGGYTFAVPMAAGDRTLIGASPELLISRHERVVTSNPLAGSTARSADPITDRQRASTLLRSLKDRREHRLVVEAVADALAPHCIRLTVPAEPHLVSTPTMWHLSTRVHGHLRSSDTCSLTLAAALHPTPAVCGTPTATARAAITDLEGFERGLYAGLVGWSDARGDGEWAVAIRCAEVSAQAVRLFVGAGIVSGSDPEHELAETSAKASTLLHALGVRSII
ncbi:isochorismate synthase [Streptosporangium sp. CA-115845]|uniref:isochorismate synthase n=1 Tax=Streptosporangium sp. CA-115845 TaxID=3240071 RepID=UPI003D9058E4